MNLNDYYYMHNDICENCSKTFAAHWFLKGYQGSTPACSTAEYSPRFRQVGTPKAKMEVLEGLLRDALEELDHHDGVVDIFPNKTTPGLKEKIREVLG